MKLYATKTNGVVLLFSKEPESIATHYGMVFQSGDEPIVLPESNPMRSEIIKLLENREGDVVQINVSVTLARIISVPKRLLV